LARRSVSKCGGWERVKTLREKKVYQRNDERILGDGAFVERVPASAQEIEVLVMEELIYVKKTPEKGLGVFAARDILKDEIITEFKGPFVKIEQLDGIPREVQDHLFNVGVGEYLIAREPGVRTNHSCDPNAGIIRDVFLVAMRDIKKDEEVTFDYSMITADDWTLECSCGSSSCRKRIGNYRDLPVEIKKKYENYTPDWIKRT